MKGLVVMLILIQIFALLQFSLAEENALPQLKKAQTKLRGQIKVMIAKPTCMKSTDCAVAEMGNGGGCGNPNTFWAYSRGNKNVETIKKLVRMERQLAHKIVQKSKKKGEEMMMGTCGYKSPQVKCVENNCKI